MLTFGADGLGLDLDTTCNGSDVGRGLKKLLMPVCLDIFKYKPSCEVEISTWVLFILAPGKNNSEEAWRLI